ncbi:MAG TPA: hypothetical protein VH080_07490 [Gemmatimonadaceae bacterium]|nr:hypothetical protein [Gemmatimonadaceae bacterium]
MAMTADELLQLAVADKRTELVRGQLVDRADGSQAHLGENDQLDGESVVPGFRCGIRDVVA